MAKVTQCIICNSGYANTVKDMLDDGTTQQDIVEFMKRKGIKISRSCVYRHKKNHIDSNQTVKQIQPTKIIIAKQKAKGDRVKATKGTLDKSTINSNLKHELSNIVCGNDDDYEYEEVNQLYLTELQQLTEDFDLISELIESLAIAKNRMKRGLKEELDNELVLSTTGRAIKDYVDILKDLKDILAGADSIEKIRYTQMVDMITSILGGSKLSDKSKFEIMTLLPENPHPSEPIRPS